MGLQEYWSGLPCPPTGDLPDPGIKSTSIMSIMHWLAGSLPQAPAGKPEHAFTQPKNSAGSLLSSKQSPNS